MGDDNQTQNNALWTMKKHDCEKSSGVFAGNGKVGRRLPQLITQPLSFDHIMPDLSSSLPHRANVPSFALGCVCGGGGESAATARLPGPLGKAALKCIFRQIWMKDPNRKYSNFFTEVVWDFPQHFVV